MIRKILSVLVLIALVLQIFPSLAIESSGVIGGNRGEEKLATLPTPSNRVVKSQKDYTITTGVTESQIVLTDTEGNNQLYAFMATISPNAKVTFKVNYPGYYTAGSTVASRKTKAQNLPFSKQRVTLQAADYTAAMGENVLFATNSDMANLETYQSRGCIILEGNLVQRSDVDDPEAYFAILKDGTFDIRGYDEPYHDVEHAASGRQWLVKDGVTQRFGDTTLAPRNAIGIKADGTVMTFCVDGRQEHTVGTTLREMAAFMYAAGCVEAVALDGGGSATFASRRNTTGALTLRNSPSDATGEREVTTSLLLVATECRHTYAVGAPSIDNSHIVTCTQCAHATRIPHTYIDGVCVCGATEHGDGELYFGFDNDHLDRPHYNSSAYLYTNFDTPAASNSWFRSFWSTHYNGSATGYTINNTTGTLSVNVTKGYSGSSANGNLTYGPWLRTTTKYGTFPGNAEEDSKYHALNYDPSQAEFLRIRFKPENCVTDTEKTPTVVLAYHYKKDGVFAYGTEIPCEYSYTNGSYVTLTIPLSDSFRNADVITNIGFRFQNIYSESDGKLTIDYIYFGKNSANKLYFDFTGDFASRDRYADPAYTYHNFDYSGSNAWSTHYNGSSNGYVINNEAGVIEIDVTEGHSGTVANGNVTYGPWLKTTKYGNTMTLKDTHDFFPLMYQPSATDYLQIRLKTVDCVADTGKSPRAVFEYNYIDDGVRNYANDMVASWTIREGEYVILTVPASSKFKSVDLVENFGIRFQNVKSATGGKIIIDYIYVGPRNELPSTDYSVTFLNWDGSELQTVGVLRGETAIYTGNIPVRPSDNNAHYGFGGWNCELTNVSSNLVATAQYEAMPHVYAYTPIDHNYHSATCEICGFAVKTVHSFADGLCVCGEKEIKEPVMESDWKMGHTLNLASDISVNFAVSKTLLTGFDMDTVYILSEVDIYEGNSKTGTKVVKILPVEQGNYYYFTLTGLTAIHMNDSARSVLYGTKEGQVYYSAVDEYSIATYAYSQMNKASVPESLKILCADLLRYGSAAQAYKGYRTDSLADSAMTDGQKAYLSDIDAVTFGNTNRVLNDLENATITWAGKALNLESKVEMKFVFDPKNYDGDLSDLTLKVSYSDVNGETKTLVLRNAELYNTTRNLYAFTLDALLAAELRAVVSAQVYEGNTPVSCTLEYSPDTYGNNKTGKLADLCKALFAYSDSAKTYFVG